MRARTVNFERGQDPKSALDIGVAKLREKITSDDLQLLEFGWDMDKQQFDPEEFKREYRFEDDTEEDRENFLKRATKVALALKDKILLDPRRYDWKEEEELEERLREWPHKEYPHAYDAHEGIDDTLIVWSKVELPNAPELFPSM